MSRRGKQPRATRRTQIPIGYVESSPEGNRAARRLFAKEQKARVHGRATGPSTGGSALVPPRIEETP